MSTAPKPTTAPAQADSASIAKATESASADKATTSIPSDSTSEEPATVVVEEKFPHKVFVGNLAFKTTPEGLISHFSPAGKVEEVNIITRGVRSLGYGFVAFSTLAECEAAVSSLNGKTLDDRELNIQVAKPKVEKPAKPAKAPKAAAEGETTSSKSSSRRRRRSGRKGAAKSTEDLKQQETEDGVIVSKPAGKSGSGRRAAKAKPAPREKRVPTGPPSKTTVFVANLPFSTSDEELTALFPDFKIKNAKIVRRRATNRSKGFGFVEFENNAEQERLLAKVAEKPIVLEERELNIKVALSDEEVKPAEETEEQSKKEEESKKEEASA
ncbi:MAG: hypothetical protein DHS80DRAFT_22021 [Piptocephalis tieghemiana]|nr:MAG: hypothetical protein DHS80DRAFT_22021 [Piptocephalis tieghemiana]